MSHKPRIYLLRHGEKPFHGTGLNAAGLARAEGLVHFFACGRSEFNIQHIIAQKPKAKGKRGRPHETVLPLAQSLGLAVNTDREREEVGEVAADILSYVKDEKTGDVLVCWEHKRLRDIATAIGIKCAPDYDHARYDLLWKLEEPYDTLYVATYGVAGSLGEVEWVKAG